METFKVGDFVRHAVGGGIFKIQMVTDLGDELFYHDDRRSYRKSSLVQWEPKDGEWVVVQNFLKEDCFEVIKYNIFFHSTIDCEPFIGELPSFAKDE